MNRSHYPALRDNSEVIHFDSSAAFPLHEQVIESVSMTMKQLVGSPDKASYNWAIQASRISDECRETVAGFLGTSKAHIFFSYSATNSIKDLCNVLMASGTYNHVIYSPEDHESLVTVLGNVAGLDVSRVAYSEDGIIDIPDHIVDSSGLILFLTHIHPLYGRQNDIARLRRRFPLATLIVDASQSVGRSALNVSVLGCDALFFSAQKLGALPGVGACYLSPRILRGVHLPEPHTLPFHALASFNMATQLLQEQGLEKVELKLSRLTHYFIERARASLPEILFSKGPAYSQFNCSGYGIISFKVPGYSSQDLAMILNDHHINVRAADHCVDAATVDKDVVRISIHVYNTTEDIDRVIEVLRRL